MTDPRKFGVVNPQLAQMEQIQQLMQQKRLMLQEAIVEPLARPGELMIAMTVDPLLDQYSGKKSDMPVGQSFFFRV